jgi:hypothetical protein
MRRSGSALVAALAVILFPFSGAAYGLSDNPAIDNAGELHTREQASPQVSDPVREPDSNEKGEAAGEGASTGDNLPPALIGSGLVLSALTIDGDAKSESLEDHPLGRWRTTGNTLGDGFVEIAAGGGMFLAGQLLEDKKLAGTGMVTLEACLIDKVATECLKYAVGRQRPNHSGDKMSFFSGHTSVTAALAATVSEMYDLGPQISGAALRNSRAGGCLTDGQQHALSLRCSCGSHARHACGFKRSKIS